MGIEARVQRPEPCESADGNTRGTAAGPAITFWRYCGDSTMCGLSARWRRRFNGADSTFR
jgi:hypothetical protein